MNKYRAIWLLPITIVLWESTAVGHGVLGRDNKVVGDYQAVMESSADVPDPYEKFAITYVYLLLNKDGSQYVSFDSARVTFAPKKGGTIVNAELDGPKNGLPGTELDIAMPGPGDYESEVTFLRNDRAAGQSKEIAKASFEFSVKALPKTTTTEISTTSSGPAESASSSVPRYVWAFVLFAVGITIGRFSTRIYHWAFSD
jgi:hypothetical protein